MSLRRACGSVTVRWLTSVTSMTWCALKTMRDACRQTSRPQGPRTLQQTAAQAHRADAGVVAQVQAGRRHIHWPCYPSQLLQVDSRHDNFGLLAGRAVSRCVLKAFASICRGQQDCLKCKVLCLYYPCALLEASLAMLPYCMPHLDEL
jgi:hypothetical protein